MSDWQPSHPRAGILLRFRHTVRAAIPAIVWVCTALVVGWLGMNLPTTGPVVGIVEAQHGKVTTPTAGRIAAVLVSLHQEVERDQVIARLSDTDVRFRLSQTTYELEQMRADMAKETAALAQATQSATASRALDAGVEQRRLISAAESAQLEALTIRAQLEEAKIRVQGAAIESERLASLATQGMVGDPELVRIRTEHEALQKRISELETLHSQHQSRVETAQARVREFAPADLSSLPIDDILQPLRWALKGKEVELEQIAESARGLELRAPLRGRIATIVAREGEWIPAGTTLATIVESMPYRIVAYVPATVRNQVAVQQNVRVQRPDTTVIGNSTISSISPCTVRLPPVLWREANREEWGFEVIVATTGHEVPGEHVHLQIVD